MLLEMSPLSKNNIKQKKKTDEYNGHTVRMYQVKIITVLQIQYYGPVLTKRVGLIRENLMKIRSKNKGNPKCTF